MTFARTLLATLLTAVVDTGIVGIILAFGLPMDLRTIAAIFAAVGFTAGAMAFFLIPNKKGRQPK